MRSATACTARGRGRAATRKAQVMQWRVGVLESGVENVVWTDHGTGVDWQSGRDAAVERLDRDAGAPGEDVVEVQRTLGVPVKLVGLGEGPDDLAPFDAGAFVARTLEEISDDELRRLSADDLAAVREAEVGARNRSTLLSRIDAVAGETNGGGAE